MDGGGTSSIGATPRRVGAQELLEIRDAQWSPRLSAVSLVCEAEPDPAQCTEILRALGKLYRNRRVKGIDPTEYLLRYRHALVVGTAGFAITGYRRGTFWPAFWEAVGYRGDTEDRACWSLAFIEALRRLGLPTFDELVEQGAFPYLTRILMHTGIPDYCLPDFFGLVAERRRIAHVSPEEFVDWAAQRAAIDRLADVDVPVGRFLRFGGSYAVDLVDRVYDLLDRLVDGLDDSTTLLPARFGVQARQWWETADRPESGDRRPSRSDAGRRPRVILDPYGEGVVLRLPPLNDLGRAALWHLTTEDTNETVRSTEGGAVAAPTDYSLSRPVSDLMITLGDSSLSYQLPIVDRSWPMLAFDSDGRRLSATVPLPRSDVWILHPEEGQTDVLLVEGDARSIAEAPLPYGWFGWRLRYLDLTDVQALGLRDRARRWSVATTAAAQIQVGPSVRGVRSASGGPVHRSLPTIVLPPGAESLIWEIEVRSDDGDVPLAHVTTSGGDDPNVIWHRLPRPVLGTFVIHVRGPLGRSARRVVTIAEDLSMTASPSRRLMTRSGLVPVDVRVEGARGLTVSPARLRLPADETSAQVSAHAPGASATLSITPAHMAVAHDHGRLTVRWRTSPLDLVAEDMTGQPGSLLVTVGPDATGPVLLARAVSGEILQTLAPKGPLRGGTARFALAELGDTVGRHGHLRLEFSPDGLTEPTTVSLCALVRPRRLADDLTREGGVLRFGRFAAGVGLTAGVYAPLAPWWGVTPLPVRDGQVDLPPRLATCGPLRVVVRIDDPWAPDGWPSWPRPGDDTFTLAGVGHPEGDDDERTLAAFLGGASELPSATTRPELFWTALVLLPDLVPRHRLAAAAEQIGVVLSARPGSSLLALVSAEFEREAKIVALIRSGLPSAAVETDDLLAVAAAWTSLPPAAALLSGRRLVGSAGVEGGEVLELRHAARERCGAGLESVLSGAGDPSAATGRPGASEEQMAHFSPEQLRQLRRAVALVPRGLLDTDTRAEAALALFDARGAAPLASHLHGVTRLVREIKAFFSTRTGDPAPLEALRARLPAERMDGWRGLPAFSLGAALTARAAGSGDRDAGRLAERHRPLWVALAQVAPDLVALDLVLAEALRVRKRSELSARPVPRPPGSWRAPRAVPSPRSGDPQ